MAEWEWATCIKSVARSLIEGCPAAAGQPFVFSGALKLAGVINLIDD